MRQVFNGLGASRGSALGRARVRLPHALEVARLAHAEEGDGRQRPPDPLSIVSMRRAISSSDAPLTHG